jgi:hypothetical protein
MWKFFHLYPAMPDAMPRRQPLLDRLRNRHPLGHGEVLAQQARQSSRSLWITATIFS